MTTLDLPVLDFRDLRGPEPSRFVDGLADALHRWGFVAVTHHGLDPALLDDAYALAAGLFALPAAEKARTERPGIGRQRGYTGFGVETAKDRAVADLKEFWQIGRELPAEHPLVAAGEMPPNPWPDDPPGFAATFRQLYAALDGFANELLRAIALGLGQDDGVLVDAVRDGNSVLRVIHYPPVRDSDPADAVRAAAHEDINLLTVLPASTQPGLELLDRDGVWRPLGLPPDVVVCDTGDLMARYTGGRLPATTHRVVNPPGAANVDRYSMPFFVHPRPDWVIGREADGSAVTAGALLRQRLRENRVL